METVRLTQSAKQVYIDTDNECESFDAFINIMVQLVEKYGKLVLQDWDNVA